MGVIGADVLVVGAGLAGTAAACAARSAGARVVIVAGRPGASGRWSGAGDVFGRDYAPHQPGWTALPSAGPPRPLAAGRAARLSSLIAARPSHPFARIGATQPDTVAGLVSAGIDLLQLPGTLHPESVTVATNAGALRSADFTAETIGVVGAGGGVFLGISSWPTWDPLWTARQASACGLPWTADWIEDGPVVAGLLSCLTRWCAPGVLLRRFGPENIILPGVLGRTFEEAARARREWEKTSGGALGELAAAFDSAHGLRLAAHLRARAEPVDGTLDAAPSWGDGAWRVGVGTEQYSARSLVIATGACARLDASSDWIGPWATPSRRPSANTGASPLHEQPFLTRGIETNARLRADLHGHPIVCGAALAGHDFAHDGTAFGVALATGVVAGREAAS